MTNKQYKKVLSMYKEGISAEICIASIIELNPLIPSVIVAQWILRFMDESRHPATLVDNEALK